MLQIGNCVHGARSLPTYGARCVFAGSAGRALSIRARLDYRWPHERQHLREPSAGSRSAGRQSAAGGADLSVGEIYLRRRGRDHALRCAASARGFFIRATRIRRCGNWSSRWRGSRAGRTACWSVPAWPALPPRLLSLCKQGDHVLAFIESYGPTRYIVQHLLAKYGVTHTLLSIEDLRRHRAGARGRPRRGWWCSRVRRIP